MTSQTQQPYKVYYSGPVYDPIQSDNNRAMYPMEQYGSHQAYSRQLGLTTCNSLDFTSQSHPQQESHMQVHPVHNPSATSSHTQLGSSSGSGHPIDSFAAMDYPHPIQRIQQLPHPNMRPPSTTPMQTGGPTITRHPIPPVASYAVMDRRVPDLSGTTEVYPSGSLNPVWPSIDTCSSAYTPELPPTAPPESQVNRNGFKGLLAPGISNTIGVHPADPRNCPSSGVGGNTYASDFGQLGRPLIETDPSRTPGPCTADANGPPPNAASFMDRGLGPHAANVSLGGHSSAHRQQQQQPTLGHHSHSATHAPNQTSDMFDSALPVCAVMDSR